MRKILTFLLFGACAVAGRAQSSAVVEQKTVPAVSNTCGPVADLLTESGRQGVGRLFIRDAGQWHEADYSWWNGASYSLSKYRGEQLAFIYAVPPSPPDIRQFLSIRTTNYNDSSTNYVNLRKRKGRKGSPFTESQVYVGQYQDYHQDSKSSGILTVFHQWFDHSRSDTPEDTRRAWAFHGPIEPARRRVLGVSFVGSPVRTTCVRFWLGPNIGAPNDDDASAEGYDEAVGPFKLEISEVKTGTGTSGRTFTVRSEPQRQ